MKRKTLNKISVDNNVMKRGKRINSKKIDEYIKQLKVSLKDKKIMKEIKMFVKATT